jgi:hypothetical protein
MILKFKHLNTNSILNQIFVILLIIACFLIFLTAFNSFYWLDDFWKNNEMNNRGFWRTIDWFYWNWDGRAISPVYWVRNLLLWVVPYNFSFVNSIIALFTTFYSSVLIFKIISNHNKKLFSEYSLKFSAILFCFLWISFSAHMSRSIYWATGSFYVYSSFGLIFFIYRLYTQKLASTILLLLFFFFGLTGINISILMILLVIYTYYVCEYNLSRNAFFWTLGVSLASFVLVLVAPGNYKRGEGNFEFEILQILINYFNTFKEFIFMFKWGFISSALFSVIFFNSNSKSLRNSFLFLCLAGGYLLPFAFMGGGAPKHTAITFHILLWISLFYFFSFIVTKFHLLNEFNFKYIGLVFLIYFNIHVSRQFLLGREIKTLVEERYTILNNASGTESIIYLDPILVQEKNHTNRFWDISVNPNDSFNLYLKQYFDTNEIILNF